MEDVARHATALDVGTAATVADNACFATSIAKTELRLQMHECISRRDRNEQNKKKHAFAIKYRYIETQKESTLRT